VTGGCIYAPYGPYFAYIAELLPASVSGAAIALVNSAGALGGFVGAYLVGWLVGSGSEGAAFLFMAGCMLAASILMLPVRRPQAATSRLRATTS
jgi:MFS family permease